MHTSVGAIFEDSGKVLMINRLKKPLGWACPAGHVEENETLHNALVREALEETGLEILEYELIENEYIDWNNCSRGAIGHDWYVFKIKSWSGEIRLNHEEATDIKWLDANELIKIKLEPVWEYWFKKLGKIN